MTNHDILSSIASTNNSSDEHDPHMIVETPISPSDVGIVVPINTNHHSYSSMQNDDADPDGNDTPTTSTTTTTGAAVTYYPKQNRIYFNQEYWEDRFMSEDSYEWLLSYADLKAQLFPYIVSLPEEHQQQQQHHQQQYETIKNEDGDDINSNSSTKSNTPDQQEQNHDEIVLAPKRILVVGCGNSPFSVDMYNDIVAYYEERSNKTTIGTTASSSSITTTSSALRLVPHIVNIDYSKTVIDMMRTKYETLCPYMEWDVMDMTNLSQIPTSSYDVVIDKAAMDTLLSAEGDVWHPNIDVVEQAREMCSHISRILHPTQGWYIQISLAQPHFRKKYLLGLHPSPSLSSSHIFSTTSSTSSDIPVSSNNNKEKEQIHNHDDNYSAEFGWKLHWEPAGSSTTNLGCFHHYCYVMTRQQID